MADPKIIPTSTADRLLRHAAALFRHKGYAGSTTRELAQLLGVQKASLYHHIRSKEDLLFEISMNSLREITAAVAKAAADAPEEDRLQRMIVTHMEVALRDQDMHTTMLIELRSLSADRRAEVLAGRDEYERLLLDAIVREQGAKRIRTDIDARTLTLALLNLLNWTIFWYNPDGDQSPGELAKILCSVFLDGAGVAPG
jgi:AcrR family transcriptional regulator